MALPYQQPGLSLARAASNDPAKVRALQRDLRALGYLRGGIDGVFGPGTEAAIRALQHDLIHGTGHPSGASPVAIAEFNGPGESGGGRAVTAINDVLDQGLAGCIARMLDDERVVLVPSAADPVAENARALRAIRAMASRVAPTPFIAAMIIQESSGQHFRVPTARDADNFVVVGLDRNDRTAPHRITSRGYGIGQYTIFHHPPRTEDVRDFILNPVRNVEKSFRELREKFESFVVGPADRADDRAAEHPLLSLRACKYAPSDARYMNDCHACAAAVRKIQIRQGAPAYAGAQFGYKPDQYYPSADYDNVPDRAEFGCDWPYAARRYNGSGNDSFHYQTRILLNLLNGLA